MNNEEDDDIVEKCGGETQDTDCQGNEASGGNVIRFGFPHGTEENNEGSEANDQEEEKKCHFVISIEGGESKGWCLYPNCRYCYLEWVRTGLPWDQVVAGET